MHHVFLNALPLYVSVHACMCYKVASCTDCKGRVQSTGIQFLTERVIPQVRRILEMSFPTCASDDGQAVAYSPVMKTQWMMKASTRHLINALAGKREHWKHLDSFMSVCV